MEKGQVYSLIAIVLSIIFILLLNSSLKELSQLNTMVGYNQYEMELRNKMMEAEDWCEEDSGHRYSNVHICILDDDDCHLVYWCKGWK